MFKFLNKFLDLNQKEINRLQLRVNEINTLTDKFSRLKNAEDFAEWAGHYKLRQKRLAGLEQLSKQRLETLRQHGDRERIRLTPAEPALKLA